MDPVIGQAADNCGLSSQFLSQIFPSELTMWINPREVQYRIGENGSIRVLYEYKENVTEPWKPAFQNNKNSQQSIESKPENSSPTKPCCKEPIRNMDDYFLNPRNASIEQLAAFISS